jgi:hypothetical protein
MQAAPQWTAHEEETIARIMGNENVSRIVAIQAMQRRKKSASSISQRLKLQDPFDSPARCQKRRCVECALASGENDLEMTAFLDMMLNGKQRSGEYFVVQRDPAAEMVAGSTVFRGMFPVSARVGDAFMPQAADSSEQVELVPKEPYEPALELTKAGIVEGRVYVRRAKSATSGENALTRPTEPITAPNVDGLMPILVGMAPEPMPFRNQNKALRGRPKVPDSQKRLLAAERQARFRHKNRSQSTKHQPILAEEDQQWNLFVTPT